MLATGWCLVLAIVGALLLLGGAVWRRDSRHQPIDAYTGEPLRSETIAPLSRDMQLRMVGGYVLYAMLLPLEVAIWLVWQPLIRVGLLHTGLSETRVDFLHEVCMIIFWIGLIVYFASAGVALQRTFERHAIIRWFLIFEGSGFLFFGAGILLHLLLGVTLLS